MCSIPYVAGIIDGEGCICFSRTRSSYFPRVLVVNTCLELLERLQHTYGGDIHENKYPAKRGWRTSYQWRLSHSRAVELLDQVYPFLIVKKAQAEVIFAWDTCRPGSGRNHRFDPETLNLLREQMAWLNKKGSVKGEEPMLTAMGGMSCH